MSRSNHSLRYSIRFSAQIWHDIEDMKLALTIIQAGNLPLRPNGDQPYTFITGKMLFEDRGFDMFETKVIHSSNPVYNETFVFHEVENVDVLHLEVLLWDKKQYHSDHSNQMKNDDPDEFLGMIQLPLNEANLEDEPRWYELRDRQTRKPSTSSVTFKSSSAESGDSFRKMPPLVLSNKNVEQGKTSNDLLTRVLNRSMVRKVDSNRRTSSPQKSHTRRMSTSSPPVPSIVMTTNEDDDGNPSGTSSTHTQSVKLRRRISKGILKFFDTHARRSSESASKISSSLPSSPVTRKPSTHDAKTMNIDTGDDLDMAIGVTFDTTPITINKSPRHSTVSTTHDEQSNLVRPIPLQQMPIGQLMLPYIPSSRHSSISGSRKSSATSYCDSDDDIDRYFTLVEQQQEEQANESNNVQTHTVGPGQVTPRNYENMINDYIHMGQIQLGLIVTKGLLEIDVIAARRLERVIDENGNHQTTNQTDDNPPDTYVKTYLRTGTRRVQKRKTTTIKANHNPEYHAKLKYNACNVMGELNLFNANDFFHCHLVGRRLQVTVWQRAGKFEKNQCIGEAFIQLDHLTLTQHTTAWYKLFRENLVESEFYDSS